MKAPRPEVAGGRRIIRPLQDFIDAEILSGILLLGAAVAALIWANSPAGDTYESFWHTEFRLAVGSYELKLDLRHVVNDLLMALFFFVAGLEIKREFVEGELRNPRRAALPVIAAIGGMVVPALVYTAIATSAGEGTRGWGIPMATDIAMALAVLAVVSKRLPPALKLFLLSLAIVDDIGAIAVVAIFYTEDVAVRQLLVAAGLLVAIVAARNYGVRWRAFYGVLGAAFWLTVFESGIHATIAGVLLAFVAPARPIRPPEYVDPKTLADVSSAEAVEETLRMARESISVLEWMEHLLHRWTGFVIAPLFALANAGIALSTDSFGDSITSTVTVGIVAGLVVGKCVGITGAAWIACKLGIAERPAGVMWTHLFGVATIAGVGFTVSLFVSELAFGATEQLAQAKLGVLVASVLAGTLGALVLSASGRRQRSYETTQG